MIKENMDKRCGNSWHVVVGEGFGFELTHEMKNLLHMYFGGNLVILFMDFKSHLTQGHSCLESLLINNQCSSRTHLYSNLFYKKKG